MTERIIPNFFIMGAPKCGTTSLNEYLRSHPRIFMPRFKEPHYFATDFSEHRTVKSLEQYLNLFKDVTKEHVAVGEASVWYLYSQEATANIRGFNKNAKLIVMLRNPVDMVYSLHSQLLYNLDEDERDFETAWRLQPLRKKGMSLPKTVRIPALLQYSEIGKYAEQIKRLLGIFSAEMVKIIVFDDFKESPKAVYEEVLSFLGVPSDGLADFPCLNKNKRNRFEFIARIVQRPGYRFQRVKSRIKKLVGVERFGILDFIARLNLRTEARRPLSKDFRSMLANEFKEDIEELSHIIGKDLSHWLADTTRGSSQNDDAEDG